MHSSSRGSRNSSFFASSDYRGDPFSMEESKLLQGVTRCSFFERDHYCKQLNNCPYFHEGIDCIKFFTRKPCTGNKCKFKHRVIITDTHEKDHTFRQKEAKDVRWGKDAMDGRGRDVHKDKHFYLKSKSQEESNKKRAYGDQLSGKDPSDTNNHSKRHKSSQPIERALQREDFKADGHRVERRASGSIEISLPPNWKAAWSKQGEIYYYNTSTGERTWDLPLNKSTEGHERHGTHKDRSASRTTKDKDKHSYDRDYEKKKEKTRVDGKSNGHERTKDTKEDNGEARSTNNKRDNEHAESNSNPLCEPVQDTLNESDRQSLDNGILLPNELETEKTGMSNDETSRFAETSNMEVKAPSLRLHMMRALATAPILAHLLRPSVGEVVSQLQQQAVALEKPKHFGSRRVASGLVNTTKTPTTKTPTTSTIPSDSTTSPMEATSSPPTCIRCAFLTTLPQFMGQLHENLRSQYCSRCIKLLDQDRLKSKMVQMHLAPHMYSTNNDHTIQESITNTHVTLVTMYKQQKSTR